MDSSFPEKRKLLSLAVKEKKRKKEKEEKQTKSGIIFSSSQDILFKYRMHIINLTDTHS